jgi:hypothetical protein
MTKKAVAKRTGSKIITGKIRLSYVHLFEPDGFEGSTPKFSASILVSKDDIVTITAIQEAIEEAKITGKNTLGKITSNLKIPLRDGDEERPDDEAYQNCYFFNASSKNRPGIVDINVHPILDASEVYSGCYARVSINFYAFSAKGNKGIAAGLGNVQKLADGAQLGGGSRADEDFDEIDGENDFLS